MPTILPPTMLVGLSEFGKDRAERVVLRVASPMVAGKTLIKRNGIWYCKRYPADTELDMATYYFLGGHMYDISDALYAEIIAAVGPDCLPTVVGLGLYPAPDTFPSSDAIPGAN